MASKQKMLKEIQQDFSRFIAMTQFLQADDLDPEKFVEELTTKIDSYRSLLTPGTDEYEKADMMKGSTILTLINWNKVRYSPFHKQRSTDLKRLHKVLADAEPAKLKKNGFMLYFETLQSLTFAYRSIGNHENARKYAKQAEVVYKLYRATNPAIATHISEIDGSDCLWNEYTFDMMIYQVAYINWQSYENEQDASPVEHPIGAMIWLLYINKFKYPGHILQKQIFEPCFNIIRTLLNRCCFKQIDNSLAVLWAFSVKLRQETPPQERYLIDDGQGLLAILFARWAGKILKLSIKKLNNIPVKLDNETFEEMNDSGDEDYKQYLGQFPIEPVQDKAAMKKIYKKGLAWKKRANAMCIDPVKLEDLNKFYASLSSVI